MKMKTKVSNPEFRQPRVVNLLEDDCRLSGLNGNSRVKSKIFTEKAVRKFSFRTDIVTNNKGVIERRVVLSTGKRPALVRYLFLKMMYNELTKEERELFLSFKESTSNIQYYFALRARNKGIMKKTIRKILEVLDLGQPLISYKEYISLKQIEFSYKKETKPPIKKPKPYTGYSKGYKDGKSKKRTFLVEELGSSPIEYRPSFEDSINFLTEFAQEIERNPRQNQLFNIIRKDEYDSQ